MNVHIEKIYSSNASETQTEHNIFLRHSLEETPDYAPHIVPMLFAQAPAHSPKRWDADFFSVLTQQHVDTASNLKEKGFKTCVLAADNDGLLHKILSPRFNTNSISERMELICLIYQALKIILDDVWVALTMEELAPGGFDASDGVLVAQKLESLGLKNIIVSSGTRDFLPLFDRRATQKKSSEEEFLGSREPYLASSLWALEHTNLRVWSLGFIHDPEHALALAQELGLAGIIAKQ
jgi:2,4-dienoyl-CoA reductase-like NADH-dependent reductase (Old Yellow Enzyme family)